MKQKITILLMIVFILAGCKKETVEETVKLETHTDYEMTEKLLSIGDTLYESKEYLNYTKDGEKYFVSLNDLSKLNYDIKYFIDENEQICNIDKTGIYFDPTYSIIPKEEGLNPIYTYFYGCSKEDYSKY